MYIEHYCTCTSAAEVEAMQEKIIRELNVEYDASREAVPSGEFILFDTEHG